MESIFDSTKNLIFIIPAPNLNAINKLRAFAVVVCPYEIPHIQKVYPPKI